MATRITIIKNYRGKDTLRLTELQEVADIIRQGGYKEQVREFRRVYPLASFIQRNDDGSLSGDTAWARCSWPSYKSPVRPTRASG